MPVFHSQHLIHIHVPRCGGTSINSLLWEREEDRVGKLAAQVANYHHLYGVHRFGRSNAVELDHLDYFEVRHSLSPWVWRHYRKFAVVRHPWDRFVSEYRRKHSRRDRRFVPADGSFSDYCHAFLEKTRGKDPRSQRRIGPTQFADSHFIPQWRYLGRIADQPDPSVQVLRLENIVEDWQRFIADAGFSAADYVLPRQNSQRARYHEADFSADAGAAAAIEAFYADDYRLLGYNFLHGGDTVVLPPTA
jgi:hypothetical protein